MIIGRVIYFIASIVIFFLIFRLIFLALGITGGNVFVDFVMAWGGFFAGPFFGILPSIDLPPPLGIVETGSLIALIVYSILAQLLSGLFA